MVQQLKNKEEFHNALNANKDKLVVIDFYAQWCGPCKYISPKVEEMAKNYPNVVFFKVDVDEVTC
jgi:thioredoxin 1